jgi:hypothetical protein
MAKLSGLSPKHVDCCVNSCCCYTGKYEALDRCPFPDCNEPRRDEHKRPRKSFEYLPIIPRLIALFLDKATAEKMAYRHKYCETRTTENVTDVFDGALYQELCEREVTANGKTFPHRYFSDHRDIALGLSLDGFAPFKRRSNSAWPVILFNYNLPPDLRTHLDHILCYGIIPGPKSVKDVDSFLVPLYEELAQLSEGVDGALDVTAREFFVLRAYLILLFGDIPAISKLLMMKGHNGYCPCRYCEIKGMRNPGEKVNYVPLYREEGAYNPHTLRYRHHRRFIRQAKKVIAADTVAESNRLSRKYGIKGLPGFFLLGSVKFPVSCPFDFMHLVFENLVPNLIRHYTGDFKGLDTGTESYELPKSVWEAIGDAAARSGDTIPSDFGARMPNIYTERSSMTAETWSIWITYLGPILLRDRFSKATYYKHFVKLSHLVRLCMSYEMRRPDIEIIRNGFIEWVQEYERYVSSPSTTVYSDQEMRCRIFYQHNLSRLSTCPFSIHALLHIADRIESAGPVWCYWAFAMERFCGAVGQHVKNRRNPYASLNRRAQDLAQLQLIKLKYGLMDELSPKRSIADIRGGGVVFEDGLCRHAQNSLSKIY